MEISFNPSEIQWGQNVDGKQKGGFCLQWWDRDWMKGEVIGFYNVDLGDFISYFEMKKSKITGAGRFGDWRTYAKEATLADHWDSEIACNKILTYIKENGEDPKFRDFSGM